MRRFIDDYQVVVLSNCCDISSQRSLSFAHHHLQVEDLERQVLAPIHRIFQANATRAASRIASSPYSVVDFETRLGTCYHWCWTRVSNLPLQGGTMRNDALCTHEYHLISLRQSLY